MIRTKIKKINPDKSNRMLYAVAAGLGIVLIVFFTLTITSSGSNKLPASTLSYLKRTEGLTAIKIMDAEKKVLIVFNSDSKNAGNFEKIAYYAALRLSRHWPDCQVQLAKNIATRIVYSVQVKNGTIASEGPVQTGTDRP